MGIDWINKDGAWNIKAGVEYQHQELKFMLVSSSDNGNLWDTIDTFKIDNKFYSRSRLEWFEKLSVALTH